MFGQFMSGTPFYLFFRIVLPIFVFSGQWYLYKRTARAISTTAKLPRNTLRWTAFFFILFNGIFLVFIFLPFLTRKLPDPLFYAIVYPTYIWEGATLFVYLVLLILKVIRMPFEALYRIGSSLSPIDRRMKAVQRTAKYERFDNSRRVFLKGSAVALSAYSFIGATKGIIDRDDYEITERTVRIKNLPDEFKGFTIGLMSDIHSSVFMTKDEMVTYATALNGLKTDIIFVPGDFVNSQTEEVYPCAEAFSELRAPYGVYGCLGNHDYFADVEEVAKRIDACGVKLLRNDALKIQKGTSFINLIGVDDIPMSGSPEPYLQRALSSVQNPNPRILLCHKPYYLDSFAAHNIDLTLAGHTHGGQVVFARIGNLTVSPASLFSKYVWGLYKSGESQMYVTRGIGTVGVPIRINCPPELTKITLQPA